MADGVDPRRADELRRRQARSQRGFYRAVARGARGSRAVDVAPGVQATVVPVRPWFSVFNAVVYDDAAAVRDALPELDRRYAEAGVGGWSVWVRPGDIETAELLAARGHREEAAPLVMGAGLDELDLAPRREVELEAAPGWADVARCNDRAHGVLPEFSMTAVFETMDDPATRIYAARHDGEIASALLARRLEGDCYFWFVATIPEGQRAGLGAELMRLALREALAAGCRTATLESTQAGERLYEGLGFAGLGRTGRWARYSG